MRDRIGTSLVTLVACVNCIQYSSSILHVMFNKNFRAPFLVKRFVLNESFFILYSFLTKESINDKCIYSEENNKSHIIDINEEKKQSRLFHDFMFPKVVYYFCLAFDINPICLQISIFYMVLRKLF